MKISAASLAFLFAGASMASAQNIVGVATDNGFTTLLAAVGAADESIATTLATVSPLTVFAPTNEAFDALPFGLVNCLTTIPENQAALNSILQYHVVAANATADSLMDGQVVDTLLTGESITVNLTDGVQIIDGTMMPANVGPADVFADNGVVHVIDKVLLPASLDVTAFMQDSCPDIPETATANGNFEVLLQAVGAADLAAALSFPNGPLTVFAPTDAAFDTVPESIRNCLLKPENKETLVSLLTYHVVEGAVASTDIPATPVRTLQGGDLEFDTMDGVTIDGGLTGTVTVVQADIVTINGYIHVIDNVLLPPGFNAQAFLASCNAEDPDIVATASANDDFDTLVQALGAADLVSALQEPGPFTVFAPTDAAFGKLPEDLLECLLEDDGKAALSSILLYHVASGNVSSSELMDGQEIATLNEGKTVTVSIMDSTVMIEQSTVVTPDLFVANGVIHVLDTVLVPDDIDVEGFLAACKDTSAAASFSVSALAGAAVLVMGAFLAL